MCRKRWCPVDIERIAGVNARLARARDEYREALAAEHKTEELSVRRPSVSDARMTVQSARERTRRAAEQYQQALDEFIKFNSRRGA